MYTSSRIQIHNLELALFIFGIQNLEDPEFLSIQNFIYGSKGSYFPLIYKKQRKDIHTPKGKALF